MLVVSPSAFARLSTPIGLTWHMQGSPLRHSSWFSQDSV